MIVSESTANRIVEELGNSVEFIPISKFSMPG